MVYYNYKETKGSDDSMKIEKLSDRQIRCILDKTDLADRHIKVSELAYGTDKAKELFRDMMRQASYELGFEAEDIPIMIEAIPVSSECLVLIITKVDDPEELDVRFSKFTPDSEYDEDYAEYSDEYGDMDEIDGAADAGNTLDAADANTADDMINLFNKVKEYLAKNVVPIEEVSNNTHTGTADSTQTPSESVFCTEPKDHSSQLSRAYSFDSMDTLISAVQMVNIVFNGYSSLYKDEHSGRYYLLLQKGSAKASDFNRACNILTEYGNKEHLNFASRDYFTEHYKLLIDSDAIQKMKCETT